MSRFKKNESNQPNLFGDNDPLAGEEIVRLVKDEMNLVEHPFGSLSKERDTRVIELNWQTKHPVSGKTLEASWRVAGDPEMGLPTANDEKVYLVAMELTREQEWEQVVRFVPLDVIKRLGWPNNEMSYKRLFDAFERLTAVSITTKNAFYHPKSAHYINGVFHLLNRFVIAGEGPGRKKLRHEGEPPTYFEWSEEMIQSMRDGNIRSLDLDFALSLERPLSMRLFRYLDKKHHNRKSTFEIGLRELCEKHLGCVVEGRYDSQLKQTLSPAHDELIARGFIKSATFEKMKTRKGLKCVYEFPNKNEIDTHQEPQSFDNQQLQLIIPNDLPPIFNPIEVENGENLIEEQDVADHQSINQNMINVADLISRLVENGVTTAVARELCEQFSAKNIELQLACLVDRRPKNPAGALVKAIRGEWAAPSEFLERIKREEQDKIRRMELEVQESRKAAQRALERKETANVEEENARIDAMWEKLDESTRQRIDNDCRSKLGVLGNLGRGEAALQAFRRTAIRDYLKELSDDKNPI